jgi:hypothetical protein
MGGCASATSISTEHKAIVSRLLSPVTRVFVDKLQELYAVSNY